MPETRLIAGGRHYQAWEASAGGQIWPQMDDMRYQISDDGGLSHHDGWTGAHTWGEAAANGVDQPVSITHHRSISGAPQAVSREANSALQGTCCTE